ncbi:serine hydrolase [Candidatus Uabimicrobium sp. HlEnr_7]|uniref:serine hydrolase n=1 Tax=Candidatus Uabimicrobium helgolandensis TaxID=3095367 RepID=UPI003555E778
MKYLLILFLSITTLFSQTKTQKFDEVLQQSYENYEFNGNVLVAHNGKVIYRKALGMANFKEKKSLDLNSQFRLASVSKQFTAMAIMILKQQKKLEYDNYVVKYLPNIPYKKITIRHLLNHTSGLPDYMDLFRIHWDQSKIATNDDIISLLSTYKPSVKFTPNERWEYSNTGYALLASIVTKASKMPFHEFMQKHIFKPLKMQNSLVYSPIRKDMMPNRVYGFTWHIDGSYSENDFNFLNGIAGDGGIYSTLDNLYKWDQALYTEKLVSKEILEEAFTKTTLQNGSTKNYGFGWSIDDSPTGKKRVSHNGGWVGFSTRISRDIEDKTTIIILTNANQNFRSIRRAFEDILYNKKYNNPRLSIARTLLKQFLEKKLDITKQYSELKVKAPKIYRWGERELETLGEYLLKNKYFLQAVQTFQLMVQENPDSSTAYYLLGKAYDELATKNYVKSLQAHPGNEDARRALKDRKNDFVAQKIDISLNTLNKYVGEYQIVPGFTLTVRLKDKQITVQATDQPEFKIFAMSQSKFYLKAVNAQVSFHTDKDGIVTHLVLHQNKRDIPGKKIK